MMGTSVRRKLIGFVLALTCAAAMILAAGSDRVPRRLVVAHNFPSDYIGPVWIDFAVPASSTTVILRWGKWARRIEVTPTSHMFLFAKTSTGGTGDPPLLVESVRSVTPRFESGFQPPAEAVSVNDGWVKSESLPLPG